MQRQSLFALAHVAKQQTVSYRHFHQIITLMTYHRGEDYHLSRMITFVASRSRE